MLSIVIYYTFKACLTKLIINKNGYNTDEYITDVIVSLMVKAIHVIFAVDNERLTSR